MENEKTIRDFLASNLSIVDSGLQFIAKEFRLPNDFGSKGYVDILAKDQYENYVVIEIKRTRASSRETLQEIFKYVGLIRQNFGAKDGEIRSIILSADWDELFVPYCEFVEQSGLTADGYRLFTDGYGRVLKCELVQREPLPKIQRRLAPIYQGDMFFTKEKRDSLIPRLIEMSESIGIRDFVILSMAGDPKYEIMYPFAACYGFNTMTTEQYEEILKRTGELDMEREEFENEQEYRDYMEQCILVSLKTGPWNDTMEAMMPHNLDSALSDKWSVDHIYRSGIFKTDPRLSDDLLIAEMRGLKGTSDTRYSHFGNSEQKGRIEEIRKSCTIPFGDMREWAAELEMCWKFLDAEKRRYRVEIVSYCPKSVFYGILRFLETGGDNALPGYLLIIDFYEDNQLYALKGELCWTRKPVNLERIKKYIADDRDALFGKPLDLVNGSFDWQVLPYMELKWQTGVLIFGEGGFLKGGVADIDDAGKLNMAVPDAESMEAWRERSPALRNLFASIFGSIVGRVTASKRKEE